MNLDLITMKKRRIIICILFLILGLIPALFADNNPIEDTITNPLKNTLINKDITDLTNFSNNLSINISSSISLNENWTVQRLKIQGMKYYDQEQFDQALESFRKAGTLYPADPEIPYLIGITQFMLGNISEAEMMLNRSLLKNPDPSAYFYHGLSAYGLGDYNRSVNSFRRYLSIEPEDSYAWFNLGQAYEEEGRVTDAINAYKSAVRIDPDYSKPWFFIGKLYYSHGYYQNAKEAVLNYTRQMPEDDTGWFFLSSLYHISGDKNESIAAIQKAISLRPDETLYQDYLLQYEEIPGSDRVKHGKILQTPLSPLICIFAALSLISVRRFAR